MVCRSALAETWPIYSINYYPAGFNVCLPRALLGTGEPPHSGCHLAILVAVILTVAAVMMTYFYIRYFYGRY